MCFRFTDPRVLLPFSSFLSLCLSPFHVEQRVIKTLGTRSSLNSLTRSRVPLSLPNFFFFFGEATVRKKKTKSSDDESSRAKTRPLIHRYGSDSDGCSAWLTSKLQTEVGAQCNRWIDRLLVCRSEHCRWANQSFAEVIARETMRVRGGGQVWRNKLAEEACRKSRPVEKLGRNRIKDFAASSKLPIPIFLNKNWNGNRNSIRGCTSPVYNSQFVRSGDQIFVQVDGCLIRANLLRCS